MSPSQRELHEPGHGRGKGRRCGLQSRSKRRDCWAPMEHHCFRGRRLAGKTSQDPSGRYGKAPFFGEVMSVLEPIYRGPTLVRVYQPQLIEAICDYLGMRSRSCRRGNWIQGGPPPPCSRIFVRKWVPGISGWPGSWKYMDEKPFTERGLQVRYTTFAPLCTRSYPSRFNRIVGHRSALLTRRSSRDYVAVMVSEPVHCLLGRKSERDGENQAVGEDELIAAPTIPKRGIRNRLAPTFTIAPTALP